VWWFKEKTWDQGRSLGGARKQAARKKGTRKVGGLPEALSIGNVGVGVRANCVKDLGVGSQKNWGTLFAFNSGGVDRSPGTTQLDWGRSQDPGLGLNAL